MKELGVSEFKAHCLAVLDEVARTGEAVTVLKRGKALARVLPAVSTGDGYPQARLIGTVEVLGDIISPALPSETWEVERAPRARSPRRAVKR
jgi:prevent-host-death family protein